MCRGYRVAILRRALYWLLVFLTLGILRLVSYWFPRLHVWFSFDQCPLHSAKLIVVEVRPNHPPQTSRIC